MTRKINLTPEHRMRRAAVSRRARAVRTRTSPAPKATVDYEKMTPEQQAEFRAGLAKSPEFRKALVEKAKDDPKLKAAIAEGMRKQAAAEKNAPKPAAAQPKPTSAKPKPAAEKPTFSSRSFGRNGWNLKGPVQTSPEEERKANLRGIAVARSRAEHAAKQKEEQAAAAARAAATPPRAGPMPTSPLEPLDQSDPSSNPNWSEDGDDSFAPIKRRQIAERNREIIADASTTLTDEEQKAVFRMVHFRNEAGASVSPSEVRALVKHEEDLKKWKADIKKEFPHLSHGILRRPWRYPEPVLNAIRSVKGVPGTHAIQLKGRVVQTLEYDRKGKLVHSNVDTKGPGFARRMGQALGTFFSIVPTPIQPIVAAGMALDNADQSFKDDDELGGVVNVASAVIGLGGWGQGGSNAANAANASNASNALNTANNGRNAVDAATGLQRVAEIAGDVGRVAAAIDDAAGEMDRPSTPRGTVRSTGRGSSPATSGRSEAPPTSASARPPARTSNGRTPAANRGLTNSLTRNENAPQPVLGRGTGTAQNAGAAASDARDLIDVVKDDDDDRPAPGTVRSSTPPTRRSGAEGPAPRMRVRRRTGQNQPENPIVNAFRDPAGPEVRRAERMGTAPTGPDVGKMSNDDLFRHTRTLANLKGVVETFDASPLPGFEFFKDGAKGGAIQTFLNVASVPAAAFAPWYAAATGSLNGVLTGNLGKAKDEIQRRVASGRIKLDDVPQITDAYGPVVGAIVTAVGVARLSASGISAAARRIRGSTPPRGAGTANSPGNPGATPGGDGRSPSGFGRGGTVSDIGEARIRRARQNALEQPTRERTRLEQARHNEQMRRRNAIEEQEVIANWTRPTGAVGRQFGQFNSSVDKAKEAAARIPGYDPNRPHARLGVDGAGGPPYADLRDIDSGLAPAWKPNGVIQVDAVFDGRNFQVETGGKIEKMNAREFGRYLRNHQTLRLNQSPVLLRTVAPGSVPGSQVRPTQAAQMDQLAAALERPVVRNTGPMVGADNAGNMIGFDVVADDAGDFVSGGWDVHVPSRVAPTTRPPRGPNIFRFNGDRRSR